MVSQEIIIPPKLNKGDTVGIISPSSPIPPDARKQFEIGIKILHELGLNTKIGKHVFDQYYYSAGKDGDRLADFTDMWNDPEVNMILMTQGGTTCSRLLDKINYQTIKNNPKIFSGISDGTILLNAIFAKTGLITFHGPDLIWTFGFPISTFIKENIMKTNSTIINMVRVLLNFQHLPFLKALRYIFLVGLEEL